LDLAANRIVTIENLEALTNLEEFWFNDNLLDNWGQLNNLQQATKLQTVYLERNPIWKDGKDVNYRRKIKLALPSLTQIDATLCR
jgi:protein phosphatase 1 regulatory subunit 7